MRLAGAVLLVVLAGTGLRAQQPAAPIVLDVVVDGAGPRALMSPTDFSISDGNQPVVVASLRLVEPSSDPAPLPAIARDEDEASASAVADRLVGIYLDEYHLAAGAGFGEARAAVAAFIRHELGPRDLVVVLRPLDSLVSIRMTSDREHAAQIVESASARAGDYAPRSAFEQSFIAGAPARIDEARRQITLSALSALVSHLGRFPAGRKTLVVVSDGIAGNMPSRTEPALPGLESIARTANRGRVAVYAVRPSAPPETSTPRNELATLAEQTTGFIIEGGAAAAGLKRVQRDAGRYYLLTFAPGGAGDGQFRNVTVSLRTTGTTVRARAGYFARNSVVSTVRASSSPVGLAIRRRTSPLVRTWFGQSAGSAGRTRVVFVWEPAPSVPGERRTAAIPARVSLSVRALDGTLVFSGAAPPSGRGVQAGLAGAAHLAFETTSGAFLVQMDVIDATGRTLDHDVRDLQVGGFPGPLAFGTAAIFRARTVRELRAIADGTEEASPVASRQFSRKDHMVVRLPVVSRAGPPDVTVRLRSRYGALMMGELAVTMVGTANDIAQVDVPLAPLASGGYVLEFTARNAAGSALDRLEFGVTP